MRTEEVALVHLVPGLEGDVIEASDLYLLLHRLLPSLLLHMWVLRPELHVCGTCACHDVQKLSFVQENQEQEEDLICSGTSSGTYSPRTELEYQTPDEMRGAAIFASSSKRMALAKMAAGV